MLRLNSFIRFKMRGSSLETSLEGIYQLREKTSRTSGLMGKLPPDLKIKPQDITGIYGEWLIPSKGHRQDRKWSWD